MKEKRFKLEWNRYPDLPQEMTVKIGGEDTGWGLWAKNIEEAIKTLHGVDTTFTDGNGKEYTPGFPDYVSLIGGKDESNN